MLDYPILDEICRNVMRSYTYSAAQRASENKNVAKIGLVSRQAHNMALSIFQDFDLITFIKVSNRYNRYKAVLKRPFKNIRCDYIVKDTSTFNRQAKEEILIPVDFVPYFWKKFPHKLWALEVPFWYYGNDEILETLNKIRNIEFIILSDKPRNEGAKDCLKNVFENNKTTLKHVDDEFGIAIALKLIPPNLRLQTYYIDAWKCYAKKFISNRDHSHFEMMPHARLVQNNIDESIPPVNTIIYLMDNRMALFKLGLQNSTAEKFVVASRDLTLVSNQDFEPNNRVKEVMLSYLHGPPNDTSTGLKWPGHQEKLVRAVAELSKYLNALEKVSLKFTLMDRKYGKDGYFHRENNEELFMQFCDEFKKSMLTFLVLFEMVNSRFNFEIFFHLAIQYEKYGIVDRTTLEQHFPDCHWVIEELNRSQVQVRETRYQDRIICVFSVSRLFVNGNHRFKAEALILGMQPPTPEELDRRPPRTMQLARKVVGPQPHSRRQLAKKVITQPR